MCPTEPRDLVFSLGYLVSNGRQVLLGGIRLDGSTTGGELNHGINPCVILCLCCYTCVLVVVEVISRIEVDLLVCGVPTTLSCRSVIYHPIGS